MPSPVSATSTTASIVTGGTQNQLAAVGHRVDRIIAKIEFVGISYNERQVGRNELINADAAVEIVRPFQGKHVADHGGERNGIEIIKTGMRRTAPVLLQLGYRRSLRLF
jgi:hypothetical protein